jgi:hypothetical protein
MPGYEFEAVKRAVMRRHLEQFTGVHHRLIADPLERSPGPIGADDDLFRWTVESEEQIKAGIENGGKLQLYVYYDGLLTTPVYIKASMAVR